MTENYIEYCVKAISMDYVFNYSVYQLYRCKIQHEICLGTDGALIIY